MWFGRHESPYPRRHLAGSRPRGRLIRTAADVAPGLRMWSARYAHGSSPAHANWSDAAPCLQSTTGAPPAAAALPPPGISSRGEGRPRARTAVSVVFRPLPQTPPVLCGAQSLSSPARS